MSEVLMTHKLSPNWAEIYGIAQFTVEVDREDDGRWIAEVVEVPGVMAYGYTRAGAALEAVGLAFEVLVPRADAYFGGAHWRDEEWGNVGGCG